MNNMEEKNNRCLNCLEADYGHENNTCENCGHVGSFHLAKSATVEESLDMEKAFKGFVLHP